MHSKSSEKTVAPVSPDSTTGSATGSASESTVFSRRDLLRGASVAVASGPAVAAAMLSSSPAQAEVLTPTGPGPRRSDAFVVRRDAARAHREASKLLPPQPTNGDEAFADYRASFTKCLPHDANGEVDPVAYDELRAALLSGDPDDFEAITLDPVAARRLANPQAALAFSMTGLDAHSSRMPPAPEMCSLETAAEMGELYWAALTRDVPFREFSTNATVAAALADLNAFSETVGPTESGQVTAGTFLRGETPGDLTGPYISQFLWKPVRFGPVTIEQRYSVPTAVDFMTDFASWLEIQRGANPTSAIAFEADQRYIANGRALGEYVHVDVLFQAYLFGALIALGYGGGVLAPGNPYLSTTKQTAGITLGGAEILDLVTKVANLSLKPAWFQKWSVHRRLRPEVYAGRLMLQMDGTKNYGLPAEIVNSAGVSAVMTSQGNPLLSQAYPEGSPTHPAYPAGHAVVAGACCTVLKAVFNEDFIFPDPVQATADGQALETWTGADLTLGGELNKLAANVSLGRDTAGVHYRSDGIEGLKLGEQVALSMLADETRTYNEDFGGYELTTFDGDELLIADGEIYPI